ncbi:MAG TPA: tetratricopeptide repeat-containing protein, partial [Longimicrobium sp.]|nr:tetratricopeptide repeat-containing protein [Longimicrobium sp.]
LVPPSIAEAVASAVAVVSEAAGAAPPAAGAAEEEAQAQSHSILMEQVDAAQEEGDFATARALLAGIRGRMKKQAPNKPEDPYILQRLALVTYKSKLPTEEESLREACDILWSLDPETSNDPETLGLWAAVHKRLWALKQDRVDLDKAVRAVERGFYLRNDHYNGINLAFLLNLRASGAADPAEAVADFVQARRIRREVLAICDRWVAENPAPDAAALSPDALDKALEARYWMLATQAEAAIGLEDPRGDQLLREAFAAAPHDWMKESTQQQVDKLRGLLADSPLKHVAPAVPPAPAPAPTGD